MKLLLLDAVMGGVTPMEVSEMIWLLQAKAQNGATLPFREREK